MAPRVASGSPGVCAACVDPPRVLHRAWLPPPPPRRLRSSPPAAVPVGWVVREGGGCTQGAEGRAASLYFALFPPPAAFAKGGAGDGAKRGAAPTPASQIWGEGRGGGRAERGAQQCPTGAPAHPRVLWVWKTLCKAAGNRVCAFAVTGCCSLQSVLRCCRIVLLRIPSGREPLAPLLLTRIRGVCAKACTD